jgi:hypothetical protein
MWLKSWVPVSSTPTPLLTSGKVMSISAIQSTSLVYPISQHWKLFLKQVRSWKRLGLCRFHGDGPDHLHLAGNCPGPSLLIRFWVGISRVCPTPWVSVGLKSTWKRKAYSLYSRTPPAPHHTPFVFPFPFNKPHLHPCILLGFFHTGMQGPRSSENTVLLSTFGKPARRLMVKSHTLHFGGQSHSFH